MIVLFTDFGKCGPYVGQLHLRLAQLAPDQRVIDLQHDAPAFDPRASAYLLAALLQSVPDGAIVVAVVDPGVGTARLPVLLETERHHLIGPDNGLLAITARHAQSASWRRIDWSDDSISATFHGRDLFAPAAAQLVRGETLDTSELPQPPVGHDWPADLAEVIYIDDFGNAWTGQRCAADAVPTEVRARGARFAATRTFGDAPRHTPVCYRNSSGLLELAVTQDRAEERCGLQIGTPVQVR